MPLKLKRRFPFLTRTSIDEVLERAELVNKRAKVAITHPKVSIGSRFSKVNFGKEAVLYKDKKSGHIFKFWRQDWVLSTYGMFKNGARIHKRASARAARRFSSADHATLASSELKEVAHHGLPLNQFSQITFVLSGMTEDVLAQARRLKIPCPKLAKMVQHPYKDLFVVEMSDLSKRGHRIISANEMETPEIKKLLTNKSEILLGIESDRKNFCQLD